MIGTALTSAPDAAGVLPVDLAGVEPHDVTVAHLVVGVAKLH